MNFSHRALPKLCVLSPQLRLLNSVWIPLFRAATWKFSPGKKLECIALTLFISPVSGNIVLCCPLLTVRNTFFHIFSTDCSCFNVGKMI